jgi:hypothetical protein
MYMHVYMCTGKHASQAGQSFATKEVDLKLIYGLSTSWTRATIGRW